MRIFIPECTFQLFKRKSPCENLSSTEDGLFLRRLNSKHLCIKFFHVLVYCLEYIHLQPHFIIGGPFNNYLDFLSPSDIAVSFLPIILYLIDPAELLWSNLWIITHQSEKQAYGSFLFLREHLSKDSVWKLQKPQARTNRFISQWTGKQLGLTTDQERGKRMQELSQ